VKLAAVEHGSGSPVVVLHGLFGSGRNWMTVARRLSGDHRVVALDLRNHGGSPWTDSMTYPEMAADVAETMQALGVERAALVGHSMGGKAAMMTALSYPDLVERLAVVDVAPVGYRSSFLTYARAMRSADLTGVRRRGEVDEQLVAGVPSPGVRAFLLQNLVIGADGAHWRPNLEAIEAALPVISGWPEVGGSYDGPTLFIHGALSDYVRPTHGDVIGRFFPRAGYVQIPDAGHWVHSEQLERFLAALTPFLASDASGPDASTSDASNSRASGSEDSG
jgi:esterase